eukprot:3379611-Amphidinium_carterae.1
MSFCGAGSTASLAVEGISVKAVQLNNQEEQDTGVPSPPTPKAVTKATCNVIIAEDVYRA